MKQQFKLSDYLSNKNNVLKQRHSHYLQDVLKWGVNISTDGGLELATQVNVESPGLQAADTGGPTGLP